MSNPITRFFGFVLHVKSKVSDVLIHLFGPQIASEIGHAALSALTQTKLGAEIYTYVEEFTRPNYANLTNDVKRLQVVSKAQAWAAAHGLSVPDSLLNMLIELAVGKVKGFYDAAGPHDPSAPSNTLPPTGPETPGSGQPSVPATPAAK